MSEDKKHWCECDSCKAGREAYKRLQDLYFKEHEVEYKDKTFKRVKKQRENNEKEKIP